MSQYIIKSLMDDDDEPYLAGSERHDTVWSGRQREAFRFPSYAAAKMFAKDHWFGFWHTTVVVLKVSPRGQVPVKFNQPIYSLPELHCHWSH